MLAGIYAYQHRVLRFYRDGTVLVCLIHLQPGETLATEKELKKWLVKDCQREGVFQTTYELTGKRVRFQTLPHGGTGIKPILYLGDCQNDTLKLTIRDDNMRCWERDLVFLRLTTGIKKG